MPLCSSTIFTIEYNFNATQIVSQLFYGRSASNADIWKGLTNLGGLVGIVVGMFFTGYFIDSGVIWLSKRNGGIYEPEFRLWFMLSMLFGVFGYVGWAGNTTYLLVYFDRDADDCPCSWQ